MRRAASGISIVIAFMAATAVAARPAFAHEGPEHVIEALNAEMAKSGATADLLYRRACEYRALREYKQAEADLNAALRIDAEFTVAKFELARILAQRGETKPAFQLVESLVAVDDEAMQAAAVALRGELHLLTGDARRAADDFTTALAVRPEVEWFLLRGDAHRELKDGRTWRRGLEDGVRRTSSPLMKQALCDALIDLGGLYLAEARMLAEAELAEGRYHSTWLIKRARVRLAMDNRAEAETDLRIALAEIQSRLNWERPDPTLLSERMAVCRLLGVAPPATAVDADD